MCGRYYIEIDERELQSIIKAVEEKELDQIKIGDIYPTNIAPVIRHNADDKVVSALKWGFPRWNSPGVVINARSETALIKNTFRKSLLERRCVVPSSGFYEWHRVDGKKQKDKYLIRRPGSNVVYMAGAWNTFHVADGDYEAFVILTTDSNDSMCPPEIELSLFPDDRKPIHDRMPVILEPDECDAWLDDDEFMQQVLERHGPELALTLVSS